MQEFEFKDLGLAGIRYIKSQVVSDERGENIKCYSREIFLTEQIDFIPTETLLIHSKKGVLRGLHFQRKKAQSRLIQCLSGKIYAAIVDLHLDQNMFGQWMTQELSAEKHDSLFIPAGYALGTLALEDTVLCCQCDGEFYPGYADGVRWDDTTLKITWPVDRLDGPPIISAKDQKLPALQNK